MPVVIATVIRYRIEAHKTMCMYPVKTAYLHPLPDADGNNYGKIS